MLQSTIVTMALIVVADSATVADSIIKDREISNMNQSTKLENKHLYSIEYEKLHKELYTYKELSKNWDGYGGVKPSNGIIDTAKIFLNILEYNHIHYPKIMLSGNGIVALFWENNKNYIEIDFDIKNKLSFFYDIDAKLYGEDDIEIDGIIPKKLKPHLPILFQATKSSFLTSIHNDNTCSRLLI